MSYSDLHAHTGLQFAESAASPVFCTAHVRMARSCQKPQVGGALDNLDSETETPLDANPVVVKAAVDRTFEELLAHSLRG